MAPLQRGKCCRSTGKLGFSEGKNGFSEGKMRFSEGKSAKSAFRLHFSLDMAFHFSIIVCVGHN
jgi:hypothetical protein